MYRPNTITISSTDTKETPKCNKKNSTFSQSTPFIKRLQSLKIMIFLLVLTSMTQTYLLFSISSTQDTLGRSKVGTDVVQKTSLKKGYALQKRQLGRPLKAPKKVSLTKPKSKRPSKVKKKGKVKRVHKARATQRTPRTHRLTGI